MKKAVDKIRNRHMIHGDRYVEDLRHTVSRFEKALKEINEKCIHSDREGQALNTNEIEEIVMKALDV